MSATWSTNADNIAGNWAQHYPILSGLSILFCLLLRHDALRFLGAMDNYCRRDCSLHFLKWLHTPHHRSGGRCWHRQGQQSHTGLGGGPFAGGQERTLAILTKYRGSWHELSRQLVRTIEEVGSHYRGSSHATKVDDE